MQEGLKWGHFTNISIVIILLFYWRKKHEFNLLVLTCLCSSFSIERMTGEACHLFKF
jgi:hypothetical protein